MFASVCICLCAQDIYRAWGQGSEGEIIDKDRARVTEVKGRNINWGLMVQVKACLCNRWPQMNFLSLPIESDRADNDPSPPTALLNSPEMTLLVGRTGQVLQFTHHHNTQNTETYTTRPEGRIQPHTLISDLKLLNPHYFFSHCQWSLHRWVHVHMINFS